MSIFDDTRADWHARPPLWANTAVPWSARVGLTWHWAGPPTKLKGKAHTACLEMVRAWQAQHQAKGWRDVGYGALVCPHARAIEGRGIGVSGSHSPSWNTSRIGVQYMVGEGEKVTAAMFARGAELHHDLEALAGHDLTDNGHHDDHAAATECPGPQVYAWAHSPGPESYRPAPPPPPKPAPTPLTLYAIGESAMLAKVTGHPAVYVTNGLECRWLPNQGALVDFHAARKAAGLPVARVLEVPTKARLIAAFGPLVGPVPA